VPVPERPTTCGLPAALSAIVSEAARLPLAVGLKVTLMVQLALTATELGQLFVWLKSPEFVPRTLMLVTERAAVPVLLRVTV
jgi:hypothetical protein